MSSPSSDTVLSHCRECGVPLSPEAPDGFCASCMLEGALRLGPIQAPREEATSPAEQVQARFGDYDLIEEIARGGMGVVYRARQRSLDRIVAVKMILAGQFASKNEVLRFRAEAETAAKLHHPNIVAVHETGEHEGQHYFSMDLVQGRSLAEIVRDGGPLPAKRAASYAQTIAQAIHYAHGQGVLHRDLKPSNVLIDAEDRPRITDFGLAKRLRGDFGLTVTGQILGSPNFMPPEQAAGKVESQSELSVESRHKAESETNVRVDPALNSQHKPLSTPRRIGPPSDVYGIGAILYHLLTGRPPFQAETIHDVLVQLRETEPVPPRRLIPSVPRDLETICLRCLEKEPARRYQTAQELADELDHFLRDEPIHARPIGPTARLWRWCRRKPVVASLTATSVLLLFAVAIGAPIAAFRINQARSAETSQRLLAEKSLYVAKMQVASQAVRDGAIDYARELLTRHLPEHGKPDLRGFEWRYFWKATDQKEMLQSLTGLPAPHTPWNLPNLVSAVSAGDTLYNLDFAGEFRAWNISSWISAGIRFQGTATGGVFRAWNMADWVPLSSRLPSHPAYDAWFWHAPQQVALGIQHTNRSLTVFGLPRFQKIRSSLCRGFPRAPR